MHPRMNRKPTNNKARLSSTCVRGLHLFFLAVLMAGLALNVGSGSVPVAHAAAFLVNSVADLPDGGLADGLCDTGSAPFLTGICTLRAAIQQANATVGPDAITLPAGVYTLTRVGTGEDEADTGDLDITDDMTIIGANAATTIVDGLTFDRVFDILPGATVTIQDVTIQNGDTASVIVVIVGGGVTGIGAGIRNMGTLTLTDVDVKDNAADESAGGGIANQGSLTMSGGTISDNSARDAGGGIFNLDSGTATLNNVTVSDNTVERRGGGIATLGSLTLTDSTVSGNTANRQGAGIFSGGGTLTLTTSTIRDNVLDAPGSFGGGIYNTGALTMDQSTIRDNTARKGGGGLFHSSDASTATLTKSTISGNTLALQGMGGGGIYNRGPMSLTNVTITGNQAPAGYGAAIRNNAGATLQVVNSTIFNNVGINMIHNLGSATFKNTIVGGGTGTTTKSVVTSQGYNLESASSCGFTEPTDLVNTDPLLGPLQLNAPGNTETHALLVGSPAVDAGTCAGAPATDQRGVARPKGATCDIGAFEDPVAAAIAAGCYNFDGDEAVDIDDVVAIASRWHLTAANPDPDGNPLTPNYELYFDLHPDDGIITVQDIMLVSAQWGQPCP